MYLSKSIKFSLTFEWPTAWLESKAVLLPQGISPVVITFYEGIKLALHLSNTSLHGSTIMISSSQQLITKAWNPEPEVQGSKVFFLWSPWIMERVKCALKEFNKMHFSDIEVQPSQAPKK